MSMELSEISGRDENTFGENQRSVDILRSLQDSEWFCQDRADRTQVRLYRRNQDGALAPTPRHFSTDEFLKAVDFYYENRDMDWVVDSAMQKRDGIVNVWSEVGGQKVVAVSLKNYLVPQMLEFAYLLVRSQQKKT